ncbi:MAG TPA: pirin family protein [Puia sp.]|jgi:redox-sensitive bicupin YhaK (pirin superfamily)|nr:pirin family protein [Puia sp.]
MSKTILYKADTRGRADLGWLVSNQSFSFADYYNPQRMGFGMLRVLNDDIVAGGKGFGWHPHDNMEIISIPLEGSLIHKDNLGHELVIRAGEIQVMSTGKGVFHSEYNNEPDKPAKFLQIWVFPNRLNVEPRYDQATLDREKGHNQLQQILSPNPGEGGASNPGERGASAAAGKSGEEGVWIYQDAWFHLGEFDAGKEFEYRLKKRENGIYLFVIKGSFQAEGQRLEDRDALAITGEEMIRLRSLEAGSEILVIEVPMNDKN